MTCHSGGSVEIYLEPVLPAPRLIVFGASPTARALVILGKAMGYSVTAIDPAAEPAMFPEADQVLTSSASEESVAAGLRARRSVVPPFTVVSTMGEGDEDAIRAALALAPAYLGVVASARRFAQMRQTLSEQGVTAAALDAISSPAGLDIGARTPEEIALSVLAEIVDHRRAAAAETSARVIKTPEPEPAPREAIDPICGMTVEIATARHTAEYAGRTWYFCCGGCRQKFLAEPERFASGVSA
jgi:xanthine dehydrogenase accessory factor